MSTLCPSLFQPIFISSGLFKRLFRGRRLISKIPVFLDALHALELDLEVPVLLSKTVDLELLVEARLANHSSRRVETLPWIKTAGQVLLSRLLDVVAFFLCCVRHIRAELLCEFRS